MKCLALIFVTAVLLQLCASRRVEWKEGALPTLKKPEKFSEVEWQKLKEEISSPKLDTVPKGTQQVSDTAGMVVEVPVNTHIVGGLKADRSQFPWQAYIIMDQVGFCGGSLIGTQWILTAAHCTRLFNNFDIMIGASDRSENEPESVRMSTRTKYVHSGYRLLSLSNDIAILKLPQNVTLSDYINIIRLPRTSDATKTFSNTTVTVSGFGKTSDGYSVNCKLRYVQVPVIENSECVKVYGSSIIKSTTICVSTDEGKSSCNGDSGGPMIYAESDGAWTQIGVVSFVNIYGCTAGPAGFARVSSYLGWISGITKIAIRD